MGKMKRRCNALGIYWSHHGARAESADKQRWTIDNAKAKKLGKHAELSADTVKVRPQRFSRLSNSDGNLSRHVSHTLRVHATAQIRLPRT